jgi:hypothetical protein
MTMTIAAIIALVFLSFYLGLFVGCMCRAAKSEP